MDHKNIHKDDAIQLHFKQDPIEMAKGGEKVQPSTPYRRVVDSLLWLANGSRLDISYAVSAVAKYCNGHRVAYW